MNNTLKDSQKLEGSCWINDWSNLQDVMWWIKVDKELSEIKNKARRLVLTDGALVMCPNCGDNFCGNWWYCDECSAWVIPEKIDKWVNKKTEKEKIIDFINTWLLKQVFDIDIEWWKVSRIKILDSVIKITNYDYKSRIKDIWTFWESNLIESVQISKIKYNITSRIKQSTVDTEQIKSVLRDYHIFTNNSAK